MVDKQDLDEIIQHIREITGEKVIDENLLDENRLDVTIDETRELQSSTIMIEKKSDVPWSWVYDSLKTCDICKQEFALDRNLSGLVIAGKYFACEHCCQTLPKEELLEWTKSRMNKPSDVRSIGVWLVSKESL